MVEQLWPADVYGRSVGEGPQIEETVVATVEMTVSFLASEFIVRSLSTSSELLPPEDHEASRSCNSLLCVRHGARSRWISPWSGGVTRWSRAVVLRLDKHHVYVSRSIHLICVTGPSSQLLLSPSRSLSQAPRSRMLEASSSASWSPWLWMSRLSSTQRKL